MEPTPVAMVSARSNMDAEVFTLGSAVGGTSADEMYKPRRSPFRAVRAGPAVSHGAVGEANCFPYPKPSVLVANTRRFAGLVDVSGDLLTVARDELLDTLIRAQKIIWLASPFLSEEVAIVAAAQAQAGRATDRRLLTAVTERNVRAGTLSPRGLTTLLSEGWSIKSIPNLHAKVSLIDRSWGLVGSGNLTGAGIGRAGPHAGNIELGVVLNQVQRTAARRIFNEWWSSSNAETVTLEKLKPFMNLETPVARRGTGMRLGRELGLPASAVVQRRQLRPETGLWIKAMYHRDPGQGEWWMNRQWIHDRHRLRPDGSITRRPGYRVGDRIVLYVVQPQRCPAIYVVTGVPQDRRDLVRRQYPGEEERYGWVTPVAVYAAVPLSEAPRLEVLGRSPQGLQNGYMRLTDRDAYKRLERRLTA